MKSFGDFDETYHFSLLASCREVSLEVSLDLSLDTGQTHPDTTIYPGRADREPSCMIGVLRPQAPQEAHSSRSNSSSNRSSEDSWLQRSSLKRGASGERYFAGSYNDDQVPPASSPKLLGEHGQLEVFSRGYCKDDIGHFAVLCCCGRDGGTRRKTTKHR